jgi:tetratricopeptide (TPR) repeat protein
MADLLDQARTHIDRSQFPEAEACLLEYLKTNLNSWQALFLLGTSFLRGGNTGLAVALLKQALTIRPHFPEAVLNLGTAYNIVHDNEHAEKYWNLALELEDIPEERAKILTNMAGLYVNEGMPEKGLERVDEALALSPGNPSAQFNKGLLLLELGRWREAWALCEAGFATGDRVFRSYGGLPKWDGTKGQKVIVFGDQGVGDEIMYASMLPDLIKDCRAVIFDCHPRLVKTWEHSFPGIEIRGTRKTINLDWHKGCGAEAAISLSSLGQFYRNEDKDFPGTPYILPTWLREQVEGYKRAAMEMKSRCPRIGISWAGGVPKTRSDLRSIALDHFKPLLEALPDAKFFSLQYGDKAARECAAFEEATGIHIRHYPGSVECEDYDRTISLIASMDLVITVCNTVVHAAGALGVPCWVLVPSKPGWRYAQPTMPWYSSVKLIHQGADAWPAVLRQVANQLRAEFRQVAA